MTIDRLSFFPTRRPPATSSRATCLAALLALTALAGCAPDAAPRDPVDPAGPSAPSGPTDSEPGDPTDPEPSGPTDPAPGGPPADFVVRSSGSDPVLVEGDEAGLTVPLSLERNGADSTAPITLTLEGVTLADVARVTHAFEASTLDGDGDVTRLTLRLDIGAAPLEAHTRNFVVVASDGTRSTRTPIEVAVEPVDAPDVYLLLGQSNMVGSSGEGTREASPGGPDASDPRVGQLNVTQNDGVETFTRASDFTNPEVNVVGERIVVAEDPLHNPRRADSPGKGSSYIGLGLTFGKHAADDTERGVVLVPAAWSGSAFCDNENDPFGQWNATDDVAAVLGNTYLFDRALLRANIALEETGGILRGILWHQGESDANLPCAELYAENLASLAAGLRTRIDTDRRGAAFRGADAPIPFVVGTMSRGVDENGDYSEYNDAKRLIDEAHRDVANASGSNAHPIPHSAVSVHDDLVPANGYPCGSGDCIHFGARALREMGTRYHDALVRVLAELP